MVRYRQDTICSTFFQKILNTMYGIHNTMYTQLGIERFLIDILIKFSHLIRCTQTKLESMSEF